MRAHNVIAISSGLRGKPAVLSPSRQRRRTQGPQTKTCRWAHYSILHEMGSSLHELSNGMRMSCELTSCRSLMLRHKGIVRHLPLCFRWTFATKCNFLTADEAEDGMDGSSMEMASWACGFPIFFWKETLKRMLRGLKRTLDGSICPIIGIFALKFSWLNHEKFPARPSL